MLFTKMHGIGNDFVMVDCTEESYNYDLEKSSLALCNRNKGIGADGLILIEKSDKADFRMVIYNSDGSEAGMCGNGTRCIGKYVYERGLTDKEEFTLETRSGIKVIKITPRDGKAGMITVDMGEPVLDTEKIPALFDASKCIDQTLEVDGKKYQVTLVSMGNPHCVVFCDSPEKLDLTKIGPMFEHHKIFPDRINTEFVEVKDRKNIIMRVWERGAGETMACGTGACATAVASYLCGYSDDEVIIHLTGGDLMIKYDRDKNHVYLSGEATFVFDGEIDMDSLLQ